MDTADRAFFLAAYDLFLRGEPGTAEQVAASLPQYFGREETRPIERASALARLGYVRRAGGRRARAGQLRPTRKGRKAYEKEVEDYYIESGIAESAASPAFRELCKQRQGIEPCQHGTVTDRQLEALVRVAHESAARAGSRPRILDLGCGCGELGLHLLRRAGSRLVGVDVSASALTHARTVAAGLAIQTAEFVREDLERVSLGGDTFDVVMAVDALYWVEDLDGLLGRVLSRLSPAGAVVVLQADFENSRRGPTTLPWEGTVVGAGIEALLEGRDDVSVEVEDFTEEERRIWAHTPALAEAFSRQFRKEGRYFLLRNLQEEAKELEKTVARAPGARYLYVLTRRD